jgi:hypothetical protein
MPSGPTLQLPPTTLPLNTMTPYLRAPLDGTDGGLRWDSWWTALGFVPVRRDRLLLPLAEVATTRSRVGWHWDRLVVGLALVASVLVLPGRWASAVAVGAAALLFTMAPTAQLCVTDRDGRTRRLSLCIRHKLDVDLVSMALDDLTGHRAPRRDRPRARRADPPPAGPVTP